MRKKHFTLVEIMIVVAIIGLLAAIAIPSFIRARERSHTNACIQNLHQIWSAQQQVLMDGDEVTDANVQAFMSSIPDHCPADSTADYVFTTQPPVCPAGETDHVLEGTRE